MAFPDGFNHETKINVEIVIADENYSNSVDICAKVYDALEGKKFTAELPNREYTIKVVNASETWLNDAYIQTLQVEITEMKELY